ncbi:hypothetical protein BJV74DRAFT_794585 [Russula compacta]|nr:hypothetical protein BJV74DRAFT_794585 [Russula compacta]
MAVVHWDPDYRWFLSDRDKFRTKCALSHGDWWEFCSQLLLDFAFKFLSAFHAAELDDEGLQLAAVVQYCGFWSALLVKTVWAMADTDGRGLAHHFYQPMLSRKIEEVSH